VRLLLKLHVPSAQTAVAPAAFAAAYGSCSAGGACPGATDGAANGDGVGLAASAEATAIGELEETSVPLGVEASHAAATRSACTKARAIRRNRGGNAMDAMMRSDRASLPCSLVEPPPNGHGTKPNRGPALGCDTT
jgi:hypothetical protein